VRSRPQLTDDSVRRHANQIVATVTAFRTVIVSSLAFGNCGCGRSVDRARDCVVADAAAIGDAAVGPIGLGMDGSKIVRRCSVVGDTVLANWELVSDERVLTLDLGLASVQVAASVYPGDREQPPWQVGRIYVDGPGLMTCDSPQVGLTLRDRRYCSDLSGGVSEASVWLAVSGHCGLGFVISNGGPCGPGSEMDSTAVATIPDTTQVIKTQVDGYDCEGT